MDGRGAGTTRWDDARVVKAYKEANQPTGVFLGLADDRDGRRVVVHHVLPSSLFATRLRPGDELLAVTGWPVGPRDHKEAKRRCVAFGGELALTVRTVGMLRMGPRSAEAVESAAAGAESSKGEDAGMVLSKVKASDTAAAAAATTTKTAGASIGPAPSRRRSQAAAAEEDPVAAAAAAQKSYEKLLDREKAEAAKAATKAAKRDEKEAAKVAAREQREAAKAAERTQKEAAKVAERERREAAKVVEREQKAAARVAERQQDVARAMAEVAKESQMLNQWVQKLERERTREAMARQASGEGGVGSSGGGSTYGRVAFGAARPPSSSQATPMRTSRPPALQQKQQQGLTPASSVVRQQPAASAMGSVRQRVEEIVAQDIDDADDVNAADDHLAAPTHTRVQPPRSQPRSTLATPDRRAAPPPPPPRSLWHSVPMERTNSVPTNPWAFALGAGAAHGLVQFTMPFRMSIRDVAAVLKVSSPTSSDGTRSATRRSRRRPSCRSTRRSFT